MEYYIKDGKVGVLVSPGWGAGWSTWNNKNIAVDKRVVEKWVELNESDKGKYTEEDIMEEYLDSVGYDGTYMGGYADIELDFVDIGQYFYIYEYDGFETLVKQDSMFKVEI